MLRGGTISVQGDRCTNGLGGPFIPDMDGPGGTVRLFNIGRGPQNPGENGDGGLTVSPKV